MSASKNRGLGKGLEALFGDVEIAINDELKEEVQTSRRVSFIDIHKIKPNSNQPRQNFSEEKINELAESIKNHGIIQPIVLRETEKGFEIVAGERRWRAAGRAGLKEVPCIVKELTDEQNILIALIENMQREDLNAIEEANGFKQLMTSFSLTQEEIAKSVGKSRPYVANTLRLLKLPGRVQEMITDGVLTSGHGRAIAGIKEDKEQISAAKKCAASNWTVRELEAYAKDSRNKGVKKKVKPRP
ncbi:MAG TPA: ParB/RepB/Spo0J family partition protein, partial [Anaerovoracaceae bacterium]|nr:ParB/RepB/Spo0J family partition protein [Anaerovoracaceae bacterium]